MPQYQFLKCALGCPDFRGYGGLPLNEKKIQVIKAGGFKGVSPDNKSIEHQKRHKGDVLVSSGGGADLKRKKVTLSTSPSIGC